MKLIFQPERIKRTTTRAEWRDMWRWKRVTERVLNQHEAKIMDLCAKQIEEVLLYGVSRTIIDYDSIINPPVCIFPDIEPNQSVDLRPGAINVIR